MCYLSTSIGTPFRVNYISKLDFSLCISMYQVILCENEHLQKISRSVPFLFAITTILHFNVISIFFINNLCTLLLID